MTKNKSCRHMFSLLFIAILVCVLSMHIPTIFSDAFSLSFIVILVSVLSLSLSFYAYTYHFFGGVLSRIGSIKSFIIIDRLLIKEKERGELVPTGENRNVQVSK